MSKTISLDEPKIIHVAGFNPAKFIGKGNTIWRGPTNGDGLKGEEEQDSRSLSLTEVDLAKILFETCLNKSESWITGEEKLKRFKSSGHIRLDARFCPALYNEPGQQSLGWLRINREINWFDFPGTTIRGPEGGRFVLCLYLGGGWWSHDVRWLGRGRSSREPSAVLASEPLGS